MDLNLSAAITKRPLFSVIIPTLNRPGLLREAIGSVCGQTIADLEVLVVNDGGDPIDCGGRDPRVRVIDSAVSTGPAAARNRGIVEAGGRYVTFLDDDDVFLPNRLELAIRGFRSADVVCCMTAALGEPTTRPRMRDLRLVARRDIPFNIGAVAVRREIVPLFNPSYFACEDVDWWIRLSSSSRAVVIPEVGYLVRAHGGERVLHGDGARLRFSRQLLVDHAEYYQRNRVARAHRLKRIGLRELRNGNHGSARTAFGASFVASPSARTAWHYSRAAVADRRDRDH